MTDFAKERSWKIFDRISTTYDPLNRLLSFGIDKKWRKRVAKYLPAGDELQLLDLATGTADQILSTMKACPRVARGTGIDLSNEMLKIGRTKVAKTPFARNINLVEASACDLPFEAESFDATTISFGIRNVPDVPKALREMERILKPGGRAIILEFSEPKNRLVRFGHYFYLRHVLPNVGGLISGDRKAYVYLNKTIEDFPSGDDFLKLMDEAGFARTSAIRLTFGVATIYIGEKAL